ncbi:MAG: carboxypeptidase regulatory-like domain-containing protein, partial [Deltaproteobacteria bacterium]|nr:carboxypeptidase regulatory-like domain-containing protein [Deltaproteobacteria bacterium]
MRRAFLLVVALCACDAQPQHSNPYDPATPPAQQAPGAIQGVVDSSVVLTGAEVRLYDSNWTARSTQTGDGGAFGFVSLTPGTYVLEIHADGFQVLTRPSIKLAAGQIIDLGLLTPEPLSQALRQGVLVGKVVLADDALPWGITVQVELQQVSGGGTSYVLVTRFELAEPDGTFRVLLDPAKYRVTATQPAYVSAVKPDLLLSSGQTTDCGTFVLELNPATLSGVIEMEQIPDPTHSSLTAPASGASVTLDDGKTTTVDVDGRFSLGGLAAGVHGYQVQLAGYHDAGAPRSVTLLAGATSVLPAPIVLAIDRGSITGSVTTGDGKPVDGASVSLVGTAWESRVASAVGAAQGVFRFDQIPIGTYGLIVRQSGYFPDIGKQVTVTADSLVEAEPITLAAAHGDFVINDALDPVTPGFARHEDVLLQVAFPAATPVRASEDGSFDGGALAFGPYPAGGAVPFKLAAREGTHTVYAQYRDGAGTTSPVFSTRVVLDETAPASPGIQVEGGAAFTNQSPLLRLTVSGSDAAGPGVDQTAGLYQVLVSRDPTLDEDGKLVQASVHPFSLQIDYTVPSTEEAEGAKGFWIQLMDGAGNLSNAALASAHASIVVDTHPPLITQLAIEDGPTAVAPHYTNSPIVTLNLEATEQFGDSIRVKLASSHVGLDSATWQEYSTSMAWFLARPGVDEVKEVWARFADLAGTAAPDQSVSITLDTMPPSLSATALGLSHGYSTSPEVSLTIAALDSTAGLADEPLKVAEATSIAGADWVAFSATTEVTVSASDGPKSVLVQARDRAGNLSQATVSFVLDATAPTATLVAGDGSPYYSDWSVPLALREAPSDVEAYAVALDGALDCRSATYAPL